MSRENVERINQHLYSLDIDLQTALDWETVQTKQSKRVGFIIICIHPIVNDNQAQGLNWNQKYVFIAYLNIFAVTHVRDE